MRVSGSLRSGGWRPGQYPFRAARPPPSALRSFPVCEAGLGARAGRQASGLPPGRAQRVFGDGAPCAFSCILQTEQRVRVAAGGSAREACGGDKSLSTPRRGGGGARVHASSQLLRFYRGRTHLPSGPRLRRSYLLYALAGRPRQ